MNAPIARAFLDRSATLLSREFLPRIRGAVESLPAEDVWWRPNEASNSVGNLLLHLTGNLRQWIVSGVGGVPDTRRREEEFAGRDPLPAETLLQRLESVVAEAEAVLRSLPGEEILAPRRIQGRETTVLDAVYHAVEHFSMHTGQIVYIAKLRLGRDLGFYRMDHGVPRPVWDGATGI